MKEVGEPREAGQIGSSAMVSIVLSPVLRGSLFTSTYYLFLNCHSKRKLGSFAGKL